MQEVTTSRGHGWPLEAHKGKRRTLPGASRGSTAQSPLWASEPPNCRVLHGADARFAAVCHGSTGKCVRDPRRAPGGRQDRGPLRPPRSDLLLSCRCAMTAAGPQARVSVGPTVTCPGQPRAPSPSPLLPSTLCTPLKDSTAAENPSEPGDQVWASFSYTRGHALPQPHAVPAGSPSPGSLRLPATRLSAVRGGMPGSLQSHVGCPPLGTNLVRRWHLEGVEP